MDTTQRDQIEASTANFASQLGLPYFDSRPFLDIKPLVGLLTLVGMEAYGVVPLALEGTDFTIGTSEETDRQQLDSLKARLAGYNVVYVFMSLIGFNRILNRFKIAENAVAIESGDFSSVTQEMLNIEPKFMFEPLAQLAYQLGASDIHVEPGEREARIRFRIDGTLHPITNLPKERYDLFASDLQMRAGVKWGGEEPQGGRVSLDTINEIGDIVQLNMRLETIPSLHGENVVIRLFNLSIKYLTLDNLHLSDHHLEVLLRAVSHPRGMVMAVGPTGSGKTSTLYSVMNHLNNPEIKIVTLEDPVEYELNGITQVPVRSDNKQSFMDKLRAVLREDPNIIMIGEIRDADTAKTALQASLTGHLVLSTFHATNAAAAISRLIDMINENPLLASSIKLIMAQRLVRKLCEACKTPRPAESAELLEIKTALTGLPAGSHPALTDLELYQPVGCPVCHHFGYLGRINILEQLEITPKMEALIAQGTAVTAEAIEQAARKEGMVTLLQDGVIKALQGQTTLSEIYAQVGE
ncbi:MAG: type IV-A pilus assembly ATPase PilB [Candidatus Saccharimonadales bacterium]